MGLFLPFDGVMLETRLRSTQAKFVLETAIAPGEPDFTAYYDPVLAATRADREDCTSAQKAIDQALQLNPNDPHVWAFTGKLAFGRKDCTGAVEHLTGAIRLWPDMVEAHQTLSATYRALGERDKSVAMMCNE
jgi:uncharacterized protein HemY